MAGFWWFPLLAVGCESFGGASRGETAQRMIVVHPQCVMAPDGYESPPAAFDPAEPGSDRPAFDLWRDIDCTTALATVQLCNESADCPYNTWCMRPAPYEPGVCHPFSDADIWCDGVQNEGTAFPFMQDQCWICAPPVVRAAACCVDPELYDCRTWPYPSNGGVNTICAHHEDCEPGLVCGEHRGEGYGICQCPGSRADDIAPPQVCFQGGY